MRKRTMPVRRLFPSSFDRIFGKVDPEDPPYLVHGNATHAEDHFGMIGPTKVVFTFSNNRSPLYTPITNLVFIPSS